VLVILLAVMALIFWQVQLGIGERRDFSVPALVFAIFNTALSECFQLSLLASDVLAFKDLCARWRQPTVPLLIRNYTNRRN
jgi:hypothetical protein